MQNVFKTTQPFQVNYYNVLAVRYIICTYNIKYDKTAANDNGVVGVITNRNIIIKHVPLIIL